MSTGLSPRARLLIVSSLVTVAACRPDLTPDVVPDAGVTELPTPDPTLLVPEPEVVTAAQELRQQLAGVEVRLSGYTGEVVSVAGPSLTGPAFEALEPLAEGSGPSIANREDTLTGFIAEHRTLFRLDDPASELRRSAQPLRVDDNGDPLPGVGGLTLDRYHGGVRVLGHHVTGLFDDQGDLHAVTSHLLPMGEMQTEPFLSPQQSIEALKGATAPRRVDMDEGSSEETFAAADHLTDPERLDTELVILPLRIGSTELARSAAEAEYRLAYVHRFAQHGQDLMGWVDALSGEVILLSEITDRLDNATCSSEGAPWKTCDQTEDWTTKGTTLEGLGVDETGVLRKIVLTEHGGRSYLGLSGANKPTLDGKPVPWLTAGAVLTVENLFESASRETVAGKGSMCQSSAQGSQVWSEGDALCQPARNRQAAALIENTVAVLDWWAARDWNGWDGKGSPIRLAIGFQSLSSAKMQREDRNAASRIHFDAKPPFTELVIGGKPTVGTQQFLGASRQIVGHEFTHSIVGATTNLEPYDEPGALDEALADLFGMAITSKEDTLSHNGQVGADIGYPVRSMVKPSLTGQPECYVGGPGSECETYDSPVCVNSLLDDPLAPRLGYCPAAGAHLNSGIPNKAHALLVTGGSFNGVTVPRQGMAVTEAVVRLANQNRFWSSSARMEEFAIMTSQACKFFVPQLPGVSDPNGVCPAFQKAYTATELVSRPKAPVLRAVSARRSGANVSLRVANETMTPVAVNRIEMSVGIFFSGASDGLRPAKVVSVTTDGRATSDQLQPGETATVAWELPATFVPEPWLLARVGVGGQAPNAKWGHLTDIVLPNR